MKILLDTCVLSEVSRPNSAVAVREFINKQNDNSIFLSVITIGELSKGIALLQGGKHRYNLEQWFLSIQNNYANHILPIDADTAKIWGDITASAKTRGFIIPAADGLIAATAMQYNLHLVTRNIKDFQETGVLLINPWDV